jgi:hypothetical protein
LRARSAHIPGFLPRALFSARLADTPLIVDPESMLSLSCTFQCFKTIGWWHSEVLQLLGIVQHPEFPARNSLDIARQFT